MHICVEHMCACMDTCAKAHTHAQHTQHTHAPHTRTRKHTHMLLEIQDPQNSIELAITYGRYV